MAGANVSKYLVDLLIIGILCTALLGTIVSQFTDMASDSGNFTTAEMALLGVIGIVIVIGVFNLILKASGLKGK